jgi:glycosyltransferase involved in cell wall biosynthesis
MKLRNFLLDRWKEISFVRMLVIFFSVVFLYTAYNAAFCNIKYGVKSDYSGYEKTILIDVCRSHFRGGMYTLTKDVILEIASKRPNWKFIIAHEENMRAWRDVENGKNIDIFTSVQNYLTVPIFHFISDLSFLENFRELIMKLPENIRVFLGKLKFFLMYSRWLPNVNLFFDPSATHHFNDFYLPRVSIIHDLLYSDLPELLSSPVIQEKGMEAAARFSNAIIAISNFTKKKILDVLAVDENKVHMIHTQFSKRLHKIIENHGDILKKYGLKKNEYLVYPSAFWGHKNQGRLIEAFLHYLKSGNSELKLVLMGTASESDRIIATNRFKGQVIVTGFVDDDIFQVILEDALAMIHPSLYEGFGMTVLEGMAAGIPVAAGRVASVPEIAGDAALYFDPYDVDDICRAIKEIISNASLRKSLVEKGKKRVEKFSHKDDMINQYIAVMESVMAQQEIRQ